MRLINGLLPAIVLGALLMGVAQAEPATTPRSAGAVIDDYVRAGLASNLTLANQGLETEKSLAALEAARARFYPELGLSARYTRAQGGRQFTVPIGQLLNPAYQTLNDLLVASGGAPRFPLLGDESFPLQLPREQDTRLTLRQPLYAPAIPAAFAAARETAGAADFAQRAFVRQLRRDIAVAYLDWLRARNGTGIISASAALLAENLRVNQSLYANGKSTHDTVMRAQAELLAVQQQQAEIDNSATQARSYVNFLLNRPLDTPLEIAELDVGGAIAASGELAAATQAALLGRPELHELEAAGRAADARLRVARAARKPSVSLGLDAGTEGRDYGLGHDYSFSTASLVASWTLFDGGARAAAISAARLAGKQLRNQQQQAAARIELEVRQAYDNLATASASLATAQARAAAARAAFAIASRRRDAGMASTLEFLDARSALTGAELNENQSRCDLLQRQFEFDYARGDSP
jgi:outer membrane protein